MKAVIEKNETFKVTGERGDFVITESSKGKVRMFAKKDVEVVEIESMPKAKTYKSKSKEGSAANKRAASEFKKALKTAEYYEHKF